MNRALIAEEENMAFSQENQDWIHTQIQNALRGLKPPSGFRKALYVLREWTVLAVTLTIILSLFALVLTEWHAANSRLAEEASFRTHTEDRLTAIEASLLAIRAKAVVSNPADLANQAEAKNLLATAKQESISIPEPLVEQGGQKFIEAARSDPGAWPVALDFVSYRSTLNATKPSPDSQGTFVPSGQLISSFDIESRGGTFDASWDSKIVPLEESFLYERISASTQRTVGHRFLRVTAHPGTPTGGEIRLDGFHLRNVILQDVRIIYSGGPLQLENVYFVNCTFDIKPGHDGQQFASAVLASPATTLVVT